MLMVLFSWIVIGSAAYIFGRTIIDHAYHESAQTMRKLDIYIMAGIIFLNFYAQVFSLFYKVAGVACTILGTIGIIIAVCSFRQWRKQGNYFLYFSFLKEHPFRVAGMLLCIGMTMVYTVQAPGHYDTGLYHAQAIRWIEEYGVVPGLGNLHMRLAYNSAFMSLQALFSLEWLMGRSLHTLNGFFALFCISYAVMTIRVRKECGWRTSDLLKCAMVIYIVLLRSAISSPATDLWAMLLILYICAKWCEFAEDGEKSAAPWCFVCLVGFYAVTVKLSAGPIILLTIYPLYLLIKDKDIKQIAGNIVAAVMIVLPWLVRNVIISGYLIYPYAGIDLFHVDWKMDRSVLFRDSLDIKRFGRGTNRLPEYDDAVFRWIPVWFKRQGIPYKIIILAGSICAIVLLYQLWRYIRKKQVREAVFAATLVISLVFWFMTAPLIRYGGVYFWIMIALVAGKAAERYGRETGTRIADVIMGLIMLLFLGTYMDGIVFLADMDPIHWVKQMHYTSWPSTQYSIGDLAVWAPDEGDQVGYFAFPAVTDKGQVEKVGLRGESFQDGFYWITKTEENK